MSQLICKLLGASLAQIHYKNSIWTLGFILANFRHKMEIEKSQIKKQLKTAPLYRKNLSNQAKTDDLYIIRRAVWKTTEERDALCSRVLQRDSYCVESVLRTKWGAL